MELGFADEILFDEKTEKKPEPEKEEEENPEEETPDEPDEEGGDKNPDEEKKEKKPFKLDSDNALWQYSTRIMGQTILGKSVHQPKTKVQTKLPVMKHRNLPRKG